MFVDYHECVSNDSPLKKQGLTIAYTMISLSKCTQISEVSEIQ